MTAFQLLLIVIGGNMISEIILILIGAIADKTDKKEETTRND